jgi:hypothetical protein
MIAFSGTTGTGWAVDCTLTGEAGSAISTFEFLDKMNRCD